MGIENFHPKNSLEKRLLQDLGVKTNRELKPTTLAIIAATDQIFASDSALERVDGDHKISETLLIVDDQKYLLVYNMTFSQLLNEWRSVDLSISLAEPESTVRKSEKRITTMRALKIDEVARLEVQIDSYPATVVMTGSIATREAFESQGMARGLAYLSNKIVEDLKQRNPEIFANKAIRLKLRDIAHSAANNRSRWSSTIAEELGFKAISDIEFEKMYVS